METEILVLGAVSIGCVAFILFYLLVWRRRGKNKIRVEILHPNLTFETVKVSIEDEFKFKYGDHDIDFSPDAIFEKKGLKGGKKIYFDTHNVLKFKSLSDEDKKEIGELQLTWTSKEIKSFIKKKIAESKEAVKPLSRLEFVMMLAAIGIQIVISIIIGRAVGAI